jgi:8-oxo-dGTP pyrophosphatase MutT (NUDIX family)
MSALVERLREAFSRDEPNIFSDRQADHFEPHQLMPAAVLVAIVDAPEPRVLLTVRHANLRAHAGQIAFPGGRVDHEDDGPVAAALREAEEEIGLPRDIPLVVGTTARYRTGTGYDITPVVAVVPEGLTLIPQEAEVAEIFEPPLAHVIDPRNQVKQSVMFEGHQREFYEIDWGDYRIWGVTGGLIVNLSQRLRAFA